MDLIKITDLTPTLGLTSRCLRYYENVGLIKSIRIAGEKYRYYDAQTIDRLKQIIVLRKMLIPIKDIIRIYESEDMSVVVETFVKRIRAIDEEVSALEELRQIVNEFLSAMIAKGVKKISALPIIYEGMERKLEQLEGHKPMNSLSVVSEKLAKPIMPSIVNLPHMRVLSSYLKSNPEQSDPDGFWHWIQTQGMPTGEPGCHERFEFQSAAGDVTILRIADSYENCGPYVDYIFSGGLFAVADVYLDEDMGERFSALVAAFDDNRFYKIDYKQNKSDSSTLRHEAMIENLLSPDEHRALVSLFVPVKKRLPNPALFGDPVKLPHGAISIEEIEAQNPIIWSKDATMDKLVPINHPHYRVTDDGEAEFISWISTRVLSTNIFVKLPYRLDIEFKLGADSGGYGYGSKDGCICVFHGMDVNYFLGINMHNSPDSRLSQEALVFHQPIFGNQYNFPKLGKINPDSYNRLTWVVGPKHFAVIINGELRYCGTNFPYMSARLPHNPSMPIVVGGNGSDIRYFKSIRVSQLAQPSKNKIKEGALIMAGRQSNNIIPNIHRFITSEHGENYWFNGCARYVMESLGECALDSDLMTDEIKNGAAIISDFGYWLFSGLTGDIFTHFYPNNVNRNNLDVFSNGSDAVSAIRILEKDAAYIESIFEKCGYASTYVRVHDLRKNKEMYRQTLMSYIDKGVPVISLYCSVYSVYGVIVGYEEYGKTLLYLTGDKSEPERISFEDAIAGDPKDTGGEQSGWVFVGEKIQAKKIAQIYREAVQAVPGFMTRKTDTFLYGSEALRAWADTIDGGFFEGMPIEQFDSWAMHGNFICVLATNGSCIHNFLMRAKILNPDMTYLEDISKLYERTSHIWSKDNVTSNLEALGGGFNVTLEALQDKERRSKIAAKIREAAECMDEVLRILNENIAK